MKLGKDNLPSILPMQHLQSFLEKTLHQLVILQSYTYSVGELTFVPIAIISWEKKPQQLVILQSYKTGEL